MTGISTLTPEQLDDIRHCISPDEPFGPENASNVKDSFLQGVFFDRNNAFYNEYQHNPRIIVGRRGAGKTTIIANSDNICRHNYTVNIRTYEAIDTVKDLVFSNGSDQEIFCEKITSVWNLLLNTILMSYICAKIEDNDLPRIRQYLARSKISVDTHVHTIMESFKNSVDHLPKSTTGFFVSSLINYMISGEDNYRTASDELKSYLRQRRCNCLLALDSLEDYHLGSKYDPNVANVAVMSGLLKCVGEYGDKNRQIRLCIPSEAYFDIRHCSANPLKDFTKNLLMHWLPSEIYSVLHSRLMLFLRIYHEDVFIELKKSENSRKDKLNVIRGFLPKTITNRIGKSEPTLPYIMRHTQFLPRQVLAIFNVIFSRSQRFQRNLEKPSSDDIVTAVSEIEGTLCEEIVTAFKFKYPLASEYCRKCLPELPRVFNDGKLKNVFNRHGKSINKKYGQQIDYDEFKLMLIEIGAVGRTSRVSGVYIEGEFEYAQPGRLSVSVEDTLCLHPLFSGANDSKKRNQDDKIVHPHKDIFDYESGRSLRLEG